MKTQITKVAFDIDGVVRDTYRILEKKYKFKFKCYNQQHQGKDFWGMLKETPKLFEISPPSEYYKTIKGLVCEPEFWSVQLKPYRHQTIKWLNKYFKSYKIKFFSNCSQKYNHLKSRKNYLLVEDTDQFPEYNRVLLVDRLYNRHIKTAYRIKTQKQLADILMGIYYDKN